MGGVLDWSTTPDSNTTVDGVSIAEGMQAGLVNNGMRAIMALVREWQLDASGVVTAGAGNAYTITSNQGIAAYADGLRFSFRADRNNTGAATLNVDGRGAKALRKTAAGALTALAADDIVAEAVYDVVYDVSSDVFVLVNSPAPEVLPGLTATVTELNYTDGVTSAIQTQLDAKQATITTLALANGGTGAALVDPNADRIMFWDDSAGATAYLEPGGGMVISGTTIDVSGTVAAQNVNSGSSVDFTVPSTATRIIIQFDAVSLNGTDNILVQIGDSGGIETTGYVSSSAGQSSTVGLIIAVGGTTGRVIGEMSMSSVGASDRWIASHAVSYASGSSTHGGGSKTLSAAITTIRITRDGTDSFDGAGLVSIRYFL